MTKVEPRQLPDKPQALKLEKEHRQPHNEPAMLESGKQALLLEDVTTACNNQSVCRKLMAEEHGKLSKNRAKV